MLIKWSHLCEKVVLFLKYVCVCVREGERECVLLSHTRNPARVSGHVTLRGSGDIRPSLRSISTNPAELILSNEVHECVYSVLESV